VIDVIHDPSRLACLGIVLEKQFDIFQWKFTANCLSYSHTVLVWDVVVIIYVNALGDTMHYEEVLECLIFHPLYFFSVIEDFPAVGGHAARGARRDFLDHAHAFQFVVERGDDCFSAAPIRVLYVVLGFGMVKLHGG